MARAHYYVLSDGGAWKIKIGETEYRGYQTQKAAINAAVTAAHDSGKKGLDSQVLIQAIGGQWRLEWTYGHDPYPPKG